MVNRAINRKKSKSKVDKVKDDIFSILGSEDTPIPTQEIADRLQKPWHSVQTRCLMLQIEGKINGFRVGRMNLWQVIK